VQLDMETIREKDEKEKKITKARTFNKREKNDTINKFIASVQDLIHFPITYSLTYCLL
jgi:hypothetical protein